jgi:hypothetical protein
MSKTNFLEIAPACEPLCAFLYFCDPALQSNFDAKAVKLNFRQFSVYVAFSREILEEPLKQETSDSG